jgi:hypothetical protein
VRTKFDQASHASAIEEMTGRKVIQFMSQVSFAPTWLQRSSSSNRG